MQSGGWSTDEEPQSLPCSLQNGLCKKSAEMPASQHVHQKHRPRHLKGAGGGLLCSAGCKADQPGLTWGQQDIDGSETMVQHVCQIIIVLANYCLSWNSREAVSQERDLGRSSGGETRSL